MPILGPTTSIGVAKILRRIGSWLGWPAAPWGPLAVHLKNKHSVCLTVLGFRLSMHKIRLARMVVVGSRRFVAGFGAGFLRL
jgi:hypothetical protein